MPRKTKSQLSYTNFDTQSPKKRRGRPRKAIAPEALLPFGKHEVATEKKYKRLEKKNNPDGTTTKKQRLSPTTSDRSYTQDEVEFMNALAEFKRESGRLFPTCSEILAVLRGIGYEKVIKE